MNKAVLIVHPNSEMREMIRDILEEVRREGGYDLDVKRAKNRKDGEAKAETENFDLVVTALEIPEDEKPSGGAGEYVKGGIDLIRTLRTKRQNMAAILITQHVDDDIDDKTRMEDIGVAREGENFEKLLKLEAGRRLRSEQTKEPQRVVVEISLYPTKSGCFYQFQSEGQPCQSPCLININSEKLAELVRDSQRFDIERNGWEWDLQKLGEALADELFFPTTPANLKFRDEFYRWEGIVKGINNMKIRFKVQDDLYPIPLEAFYRRNEGWLMLETPIYRRQEVSPGFTSLEPSPLFPGEAMKQGPINFLIIQADVPDNALVEVNGETLELKALPSLKEEVRALEEQLSALKKRGDRIGEVRVINLKNVPAKSSFAKSVEEALSQGKWHIVHYAGHTFDDPKNNMGYVFFPTKIPLKPVEAIKISLLALWLRRSGSRFVFLSSCTSASHTFINRLVREGVPAILGFIWKVEDRKAMEYAKSFYEQLLGGKERSLEHACLQAKKEMYVKYERNAIWASPVLTMQAGV